ncbi:hypothetical protein [Candidatus Protochlamydia sp. W-9]|uniref:hypothetical protein n=1 Tax=Candidatus Protochlamydia sp. W-9 TaxID=1785087 RepID=UPI0011781CA4|nr:hypothetical protein [Candidatus Protochlamydia sp. W-9]
MADKCLQLYVWNHYYEEEHCKKFFLRKRFGAATSATYERFNDSTYFYRYGSARKWSTFIERPANTSQWSSREDILNCCYHFGYNRIDINFDQLDHPHGPCFSFVTRKF